jgi:hypothetical protein
MAFSSLNLKNPAGISLIALGLIAVPLPLVPGVPLIAAGAALLGPGHPLIRFCLAWLRKHGFLRKKEDS